jgi:hypothetical protein
MRETRSYGSVRGALSNERPYREFIAHFQCVDKGQMAHRSTTVVAPECAFWLRLWSNRNCQPGRPGCPFLQIEESAV